MADTTDSHSLGSIDVNLELFQDVGIMHITIELETLAKAWIFLSNVRQNLMRLKQISNILYIIAKQRYCFHLKWIFINSFPALCTKSEINPTVASLTSELSPSSQSV